MRTVRICLLLLLAVLTPVRGAMAAAMLCAMDGTGPRSAQAVHAEGHGAKGTEAAGLHEHGAHMLVDQDAADAGQPHHHHQAAGAGHASSDHCNLCSAFCSITPLVSDVPRLPTPLDPPTVKFPDEADPAPTFLSDGQERPPRSI